MSKKIINICITVILCLVPLFYIPIRRLENVEFGIKAIILIISSIILLGICLKEGYHKLDYTDIILLVFLGFNILSTIFSMNPYISITGLQDSYRYEGLITIFCYIVIYYISKYYFKGYKNFTKILFITALIICLIAIIQFVSFNQISIKANYTEGIAEGTIGNSNYMGSYALLFIPALLSMFLFKGNLKYLVLSGIFIFTLIITTSRSAWVGCFVYGILLIFFLIKNIKGNKTYLKNLLIIVILLVISIIGILGIEKYTGNYILTHKVESLINDIKGLKNGISEEMGTARIKIWKMVLPVIKAKPILGTGPDTIPYALAEYSPEPFYRWLNRSNSYIDKAHNDYLQIAACVGIPALITYLVFLTCVLKKNIKKIFKDEIEFILLAIIIAYLVQIFFNISSISVAPLFWFTLGASQNEEFKKSIKATK